MPGGGAADPSSIPVNSLTVLENIDGGIDIFMHNNQAVGGFQFSVSGTSLTVVLLVVLLQQMDLWYLQVVLQLLVFL